MKKKGIILKAVLPIFLAFNMIGCTSKKETSRETYIMGTIVQIKLYGSNGEEASEKAITRIRDIENKMSVNIQSSDVSRINKSSGKQYEKVSKDTFFVVDKAINYANLTEGAFDITVEPLVKLWGIGTDKARIPSKDEIKQALELINYKDVKMDKSNSTVKLNRNNQAIDLGAIAKGYTADEVNKVLEECKVKSAFINLGGNVFVRGTKPDGELWNIGLQNPFNNRGEYIGIIKTSGKSIVTSGNYERYFEKNGKRYHHIFDKNTGYPSENEIASATIVSDKSIDGDALSTSVFVLGVEKGLKLIESIKGVDSIIITKDKKVYVTSGLKDKFELTNKEFKYEKGR